MDWIDERDAAAREVLQHLFDQQVIYDETFRRIKASPTKRARLNAYNKASVAADNLEMEADEFNELENAYYTEVFAPVSQQVAAEILGRAVHLSHYQPYGPREDTTK